MPNAALPWSKWNGMASAAITYALALFALPSIASESFQMEPIGSSRPPPTSSDISVKAKGHPEFSVLLCPMESILIGIYFYVSL